jgi:hypothetical protein
MTLWRRALIGAAVGAVLTLCIHPLSRPFLAAAWVHEPKDAFAALLDLRSEQLPPPENPVDAALWVQMAADRIVSRRYLSASERQSLGRVIRAASRNEPDNAFWDQAYAAILVRDTGDPEALRRWVRASNLAGWNDHQSTRLQRARDRVSQLSRSRQSWQMAYVYYGRSESAARLIERFSRDLTGKLELQGRRDLRLRYATLRNGSLMRDGSRSLRVGFRGANVVDIASYPRNLTGIPSPKRLILAQLTLYNNLLQDGKVSDAMETYQTFRRNDGWRAMIVREDFEERIANAALGSTLVGVLPSAFLATSLIGLAIWIVASVARASASQRFGNIQIAVAAALLAGLGWWVTHSWGPSVVLGAGVVFQLVGPKSPRSNPDRNFGPLFDFMLLMVVCVSALAFVASFVLDSTPANLLLPVLGMQSEGWFSGQNLRGVGILALSMVFVVSPIWALVQRRPTADTILTAAKRVGIILTVGCLFAAVIGTPLSIFADSRLEIDLTQLATNEPVYYLLQ